MAKGRRFPITIVIAVVAIGGIFGVGFLLTGTDLVIGNVSNLQLTENFRDFNCNAWNELAVTQNGVTTVVGSGRTGFNPIFDSSLLSLTDGQSEVDFMHVRLVIQCDGNFIENPTVVEGSMNFQLCGDPINDRTTCFAGTERTFQILEGVATSTSTFFNVPIQQQSLPDDQQKVIYEGDISAFELEKLFQPTDGKIHFKSVMFPVLTFTFNDPIKGIFTASYDAIRLNDPIISQYGELRVIDVDTDGDGIFDSVDGCINQPETFNGFQDSDGCPDTVPTSDDIDGDGIPDVVDSCVTEPETFNGFQDDDGCPDEVPPDIADITQQIPIDTDEDGVPDEFDLCITQVGTVANLGCPEPVIMQDDETAKVIPSEIPPPLFDPSTIPPESEFMTQVFGEDTTEEDTRNFVIVVLIIGGLIAVGVAGAISRMRKR